MASAILMAKIANDPDFQRRVEYFMARKALSVAGQTDPLPDGNDLTLIQRIMRGEESVRIWALAACTNYTIATGTHAGDGSTIADGDLEYQIGQQWPAFAG
jgi:hypothetical protein